MLWETHAAVRYRDGRVLLMDMSDQREEDLRRAGFCAYMILFEHDNGSLLEAELWSQDRPVMPDYLNAAHLLFGDEPGSLLFDDR
jgi:hypothetical protein